MRALTFLPPRRVEWREVPDPVLKGPGEAIVRPVIASRCDGDNLPVFNNVTTALRAGIALHFFDPLVADVLGSHPFGKPFPIGHECIAEVVECGEAVTGVRKGDLVIVPWSVSCGSCVNCSNRLTSRCTNGGGTVLSGYGFGPSMGEWGGMVSDLVRVPFADAMLVHVPAGRRSDEARERERQHAGCVARGRPATRRASCRRLCSSSAEVHEASRSTPRAWP